MKMFHMVLIIVVLFALHGCTKKNVIVKPIDLPKSEFISAGNETELLEKIQNKFMECAKGTLTYSSLSANTLTVATSNEFMRTFYATRVDNNMVQIKVIPEFDSMSKFLGELFKMAMYDEKGCPR